MNKKILGLDIGSNSIGFSLLKVDETNGKIVFKDIVSNSITFSNPDKALDRREARASRRRNERKSARKRKTRKLFYDFGLVKDNFINETTDYLNTLKLYTTDVYTIREDAIKGKALTKDEFVFATYSILTDRGYSNMFSISNEDGVINEAVAHNEEEYKSKNLPLPSSVLTLKRDELKDEFQNIAIRNKKDSYNNSLSRAMHKEEFVKVVKSQQNNKELFSSSSTANEFLDKLIDENEVNRPFYQRTLKSFEDMVEYCTFYDKYHQRPQKRVPHSHIKNIELTLRKAIYNYEIVDSKSGEIVTLDSEDIKNIVDFWIDTPTANEVTSKNIFKNAGFKNLKLNIPEQSSQRVVDLTAHRKVTSTFKKYNVSYKDDNYTNILLQLHYYKNYSSRVHYISKFTDNLEFAIELSSLDGIDGFGAFSLKFIDEILEVINSGKTYHESLESLGYFSKYLNMPKYNYLPPLEPTKKDIEYLKSKLPYFDTKHLFYQPLVSPQVKRIIAVLRKLINEILKEYGHIDEIRIEGAKELNSKKEQEKIDKNQAKNRAKNLKAKKLLKANGYDEKSEKNILRAKLFEEQECICLYSGDTMTLEDALDETKTEVEHFIPRSTIWIDSYKNKILVKKSVNQDKASKSPITYLKSIHQWQNFIHRVEKSLIDKNKKEWLSDESKITSVMSGEHWQDRYLNDTRSSARTIQKYLSHYLFPKENMYAKGEKRSVFSLSSRAIYELKHIWGVDAMMPKDEDGKKDRDTNYHHTIDALTIALCSNQALQALNSFFKQNENHYKTKAMKDKISHNIPKLENGEKVESYVKNLVQKYENSELYVCPFNKQKRNAKGFRDGNLKLYVATHPQDKNREILAEMERVHIDSSLLFKQVGGFDKPRSDKEVKEAIAKIQNRLNPIKQKKIVEALDVYVSELLLLKNQIGDVSKELDTLKKSKKEISKDELKPLQDKRKFLEKKQHDLVCSFQTKNGKKQIVRSLKLHKENIEESKADVIIFHHRKTNKIERLSVENFKNADEPFVVKMNENTLSVELFETIEGQKVGLNYFSGIANDIETKINPKFYELIDKNTPKLTLYKNEIIRVEDKKDGSVKYFVFNGGGNISTVRNSANNKISITQLSHINFNKSTN